jgi:hypothetical protein
MAGVRSILASEIPILGQKPCRFFHKCLRSAWEGFLGLRGLFFSQYLYGALKRLMGYSMCIPFLCFMFLEKTTTTGGRASPCRRFKVLKVLRVLRERKALIDKGLQLKISPFMG